jgi:hypothetical protein
MICSVSDGIMICSVSDGSMICSVSDGIMICSVSDDSMICCVTGGIMIYVLVVVPLRDPAERGRRRPARSRVAVAAERAFSEGGSGVQKRYWDEYNIPLSLPLSLPSLYIHTPLSPSLSFSLSTPPSYLQRFVVLANSLVEVLQIRYRCVYAVQLHRVLLQTRTTGLERLLDVPLVRQAPV